MEGHPISIVLVLKITGLALGAIYSSILAYEAFTAGPRPKRLRALGSLATAAVFVGLAVYLASA